MAKPTESHKIYQALLYLYPKSHRSEYAQQMLQTFDDLVSEQSGAAHKVGIWLRVSRELPLNIVEEYIHNWEGMDMEKRKTGKRIVIGAGGFVIAAAAVVIILVVRGTASYTPTTLSNVQNKGSKPACVQSKNHSVLSTNSKDNDYIGNAVANSIIDVPAGTNVFAYLKTYDGANATGTAIYDGKYGSYNFTAKKVTPDSKDSYLGGWQITKFASCKS